MLEVVNDDTTSGPFEPPARSAWLSLSSLMLPTTFTVMFGWAFSKRSMFAWIALTSAGALQPCQKVIVVLAFGSSVAPDSDWPVQAVARRARRRWRRGGDREARSLSWTFPGMARSPWGGTGWVREAGGG